MADQPNCACRQSPVAPSRNGRMACAEGSEARQTAICALTVLPGTKAGGVILEVLP